MPTRARRARELGVEVDELPTAGRGSSHPRWNKGRIVTPRGYVKVRVGKDHPMADPHGYAYEHDLVAVAALGRPLLADEVVHHREDEHGRSDKADNRWENLVVTTRAEHSRHHALQQLAEMERDGLGRFSGKADSGSKDNGLSFFASDSNDTDVVASVNHAVDSRAKKRPRDVSPSGGTAEPTGGPSNG